MKSKQKLPKELKVELTTLLGEMKKNLKEPKVYDPTPEENFLKRMNELEKQGYLQIYPELEKYRKKYEKLRYEKEKLAEEWLEEK